MLKPIRNPLLLAAALVLAGTMPLPSLAGGNWTILSHPCLASRTNALHRDDDGTLWVGCGSGANGRGLWRSTDDGENWRIPETDDPDIIEFFRVFDITRGHDGALYIAGIDSRGGINHRVIRLDTAAGAPLATSITLASVAQVGRQFTVGNYRELDDGRALADSETGLDKLYRPTAATGPSAADWIIPSPTIEAFTQIVTHDNGFYASGSRIAIRPRIFLPPTAPGAQPWQFIELILDPNYDGEMWGIAVNDQRVVAVGVDQDRNIGQIYVSNGNPYNAGNYLNHQLPDIIGEGGVGTWARGVCMRNDLIVVVGERQPLGSTSGQVMASSDGGQSFQNIKPDGQVESVSKCVIAPNGRVTVAGAMGFIAHFDGLMLSDELFADRFEND